MIFNFLDCGGLIAAVVVAGAGAATGAVAAAGVDAVELPVFAGAEAVEETGSSDLTWKKTR